MNNATWLNNAYSGIETQATKRDRYQLHHYLPPAIGTLSYSN